MSQFYIKYDTIEIFYELLQPVKNEAEIIAMISRASEFEQLFFTDKAKMIRFDERTGYLFPTDLGRTSSQFYIKYDTIEIFNELLQPVKNEAEIIAMISRASEFEQLKVRDDEMDELDDLTHEWCQVNCQF